MKSLYIVAGANGSGKTTFAKRFAKFHDLHFINADEIAKSLDNNDIGKHKLQAGKIFFRELHRCLQKEESFVIETTLSGKYLVKYIDRAKNLGFFVSLIYLFLETPKTNILRVKHRVLNGGHFVPEDDIIRRFYRSKEMFWKVYKNMVDEWIVYYNSDEIFEEIADNTIIYDREKFDTFIKGIDNEQKNR